MVDVPIAETKAREGNILKRIAPERIFTSVKKKG